MVKCVSENRQGPVSSAKMAEAGENISVVVSLIIFWVFPDTIDCLGYINRLRLQVRVRNLIEREKNSNQSKAFSTEDSTDVVQKSNKKRQVSNCCLIYSNNIHYYSL